MAKKILLDALEKVLGEYNVTMLIIVFLGISTIPTTSAITALT